MSGAPLRAAALAAAWERPGQWPPSAEEWARQRALAAVPAVLGDVEVEPVPRHPTVVRLPGLGEDHCWVDVDTSGDRPVLWLARLAGGACRRDFWHPAALTAGMPPLLWPSPVIRDLGDLGAALVWLETFLGLTPAQARRDLYGTDEDAR